MPIALLSGCSVLLCAHPGWFGQYVGANEKASLQSPRCARFAVERYKTILEVADETHADLIIVASHQPDVQDYFLGSTAAKVVRHARCSVLVLR